MSIPAQKRNLRRLFTVFTTLLVSAYLFILIENWFNALQDFKDTLDNINSTQIQGVRSTLNTHKLMLSILGAELVSKGALTQPEKGRELIEGVKSLDPNMVGLGLARTDGQTVAHPNPEDRQDFCQGHDQQFSG